MNNNIQIRETSCSDIDELRRIYTCSINEQAKYLYSKEQIYAWKSIAYLPNIFEDIITNGKGYILLNNNLIASFIIRYPKNRIALLYTYPKFSRMGYASRLINIVEKESKSKGIKTLNTEASLLSYKLFIKLLWKVENIQNIKIADIDFQRYKMIKHL